MRENPFTITSLVMVALGRALIASDDKTKKHGASFLLCPKTSNAHYA